MFQIFMMHWSKDKYQITDTFFLSYEEEILTHVKILPIS